MVHHKGGVDQIDQAVLEVSSELRQQYSLGPYKNQEGRELPQYQCPISKPRLHGENEKRVLGNGAEGVIAESFCEGEL